MALAIPWGVPMTVANEQMETQLLANDQNRLCCLNSWALRCTYWMSALLLSVIDFDNKSP